MLYSPAYWHSLHLRKKKFISGKTTTTTEEDEMDTFVALRDTCYHILNSLLKLNFLREQLRDSRSFALTIVFLTNMLDNLLLTSVVPIIPAFLIKLDEEAFFNTADNVTHQQHTPLLSSQKQVVMLAMNGGRESMMNMGNWTGGSWTHNQHQSFSFSDAAFNENGRVGLLLASKAIVQLLANFLVGPICNKIGYPILLFAGTVILLMSSIVFAAAESYVPLFIARAVHGLGSAAVLISGMSIVAKRYQEDKSRSRAMGIALGGDALGILIGYPFGGVIYSFIGKTVVFLALAGAIFLTLGLQWFVLDLSIDKDILSNTKTDPVLKLLKDKFIVISTGIIWLTTMSMSVLESTVPLWAMSFMKIKNWELGLIFLPVSIGYFIGTNGFGVVSPRIGRWSCCAFCMILIALCHICLPFATSVPQLILPHLGLGLGIGIADAAIMPLLALLVDVKKQFYYGNVFAIAQLSICLAYSVGPFAAGMIVKEVGFPWLMRGMAITNILFSPLCYILSKAPISLDESKPLSSTDTQVKQYTQEEEIDKPCLKYGRLNEEDD